jgi:hypothetical protein
MKGVDMAKRRKKIDPVEEARQAVAKAQLDLFVAQEKRADAIARGEQEIQAAQEKAVRRERKATERVERRAGALSRAEAWLYTVSGETPYASPVERAERP